MKAQVVILLFASLLVGTHQEVYPGCWTEWFNRDHPSGTGDWETLSDQRKLTPGKICEKPLDIEVRTTAGGSMASTGDIISVADATTGFVCENNKQTKTKMCSDYEVRYLCPAEFCYPKGCWTEWLDRDDPSVTGDWETLSTLISAYPGKICENPLYLEALTTSGNTVESTGDVISVASPSSGFVCEMEKQKDRSCEDYQVRFYCPDEFCMAKSCWTDWYDRDNPSGTGDWETLEDLYLKHPGEICESPLGIDVLTTSGGSVASTGDVIAISDTSTGLVCKNSDQNGGWCEDYKVRFRCPEEFCNSKGCWTGWFDRDNPSGKGDWETLELLLQENPGKICEYPLDIEVQTTSGNSVASTGNVITVSDANNGVVCENSKQPPGKRCEDFKVRFFCPEDFCKTVVEDPNGDQQNGQFCKYYKVCFSSSGGSSLEMLNGPPCN